jgi:hypothetical protein
MDQIIKKLDDITRKEWIAYRWIEIPPTMGDDGEREFIQKGKRTPDEAYQAMEEWDMTADERGFDSDEPI